MRSLARQGMGEALLWTAPTERLKVLRQSTAGQGTGGAVASVSTILKEQGTHTPRALDGWLP